MTKKQSRFKLLHYFSVTGFLTLLVAAVILVFFYRQVAVHNLIQVAELQNVSLTKAFVNNLWPKYKTFLSSLQGLDGPHITALPQTKALLQEVRKAQKDLPILKTKIYNLQGITVFSSNLTEIGVNKSDRVGFQSARAGNTVSDLVHRDQFYSLEGTIADRNLLTSYVPIWDKSGKHVEGVFELYTDVTPLLEQVDKVQWRLIGGLTAIFVMLYLVLLFLIRQADRVIQKNERSIQYKAHHDDLTCLPNRALFRDRLEGALASAHHTKQLVAVLFIDLDRFKPINDKLGHEVGDLLLMAVATRLTRSLRDGDTASRIGGDEFAVILNNLDRPTDSEPIAERVIESLEDAFFIDGHELFISGSVGITLYPIDDTDPDELLKKADLAMYKAKEMGGNRFFYFSADMHDEVFQYVEIGTDLQKALQRNEFFLQYQPKLNLRTGKVDSFEALLRWRHPFRGTLLPSDFIGVAEQSGLISPIGSWVIAEITAQMRKWYEDGFSNLRISLNISPYQFQQNDLSGLISNLLAHNKLLPSSLELEIGEKVLVDYGDQLIPQLSKMRQTGVRIAIDNFGSGFASLGFLRQSPLDMLKVDLNQIGKIPDTSDQAAIIQAVMAMAHKLDLLVLVKGIERNEQLELLRELGCDFAQGYWINPPMDANQIAPWLKDQQLVSASKLRFDVGVKTSIH